MGMNEMIQFVKQLSGRIGSDLYSSVPNQSDPRQIAYIRNLQRELKNKDTLAIPFEKLPVVIFDIETTGFFPYKGDKLLSIGAVKMQGDKILEDQTFYSLVHNETTLSEDIKSLTGLSEDEIKVAPPVQDVLKEFYQFIKSETLVAHHSSHEKQFMKHANWTTYKNNFQHRILDTTFLLKVVEPELKYVSLDDWCSHFGITIEKRHHALHDAVATAELWARSVKCVQEMGFSNLNDVYSHIANLK